MQGFGRCPKQALGAQLVKLKRVLKDGPAAHGWVDQGWTLARIVAVIRGRLRVQYTLAGADLLLHRLGWSVQMATSRATERDAGRIAAWREEDWPVIKRTAGDLGAWLCFESRREALKDADAIAVLDGRFRNPRASNPSLAGVSVVSGGPPFGILLTAFVNVYGASPLFRRGEVVYGTARQTDVGIGVITGDTRLPAWPHYVTGCHGALWQR
ncbi:winged helix-turn-helix domain-containing protein [Streptomyces sp. Ru73]|uniref:winged helix-turn-helix domain-containing protein n=1 Tax=Streptomyces sp. Ru73 TaxID=2080748 RepID=UPI0021560FF4|nr:winged helix-turn-helix domain-containing protein [Streptomyces sp. Ru73]